MLRAWSRRWWMLLPIAAVGLLVAWQTGFFHSRVVALEWEGEPVEFRVLALNRQGGFAVVDLAEGVMRLDRLEHRGLPVRSVDVAAFTRSGDVLVHPSGEQVLYVVPGGDFSATPATIRLRRSVETDTDPVAVDARGDQSGENIWLLKRTDVATLVDLITIEDAVLARFELDGSYYAGRLLENDLIVIDGDGRDDLVLRTTGAIDAIDDVTICPDDIENANLRVVSVHGHHTACLSDDDRHLVLYDVTTGQTDRFTAFESGHWSRSVLPDIPVAVGNTVGVHTDQLLLKYQAPDPTNPPYTITKAIYVADLSNHTVRWLYDNEEGAFLRPLGFVDDLLIVATGVRGQDEVIMSIDTQSGERQKIIDLPAGYFIYDAAWIPIRYRTIAYDWHSRHQLSSIRLPW